ncbi:LOW QUALITY PROTEIN: transcription repressor OFP7 [Quercus suber]|uniref:LOW QUALITY PROTEIN: transcription repressor OFP7 n=1 Tax=Quercus suber TaxID=58331 RepID=UPI0032DF2A52
MGRFKSLVESEEDIEIFRAKYRIPPTVGMRYASPETWVNDRKMGEVVILMIAFIEGGMTIPMDKHATRPQKEDEWHVVAKVYDDTPRRNKIYNSSVSGESDSDDDDDVLSLPPPPPPSSISGKKKRRAKKKKTTAKVRVSTSSVDSGLFSSDGYDDEETETLVSSSRSFSTDSSSEFNPNLETIREMPPMMRRKPTKKSKKRCVSKRKLVLSSPESESPARLSMFQRLIPCTVEGKVRESFAVVKKSEDPYEDFKRSMMEMILEKQMFDEKDLEQLLHCFLSLNDREHHGVIVQAFSEIWEALFCRRTSTRTSQRVSTS